MALDGNNWDSPGENYVNGIIEVIDKLSFPKEV
jgi:hypothetical protein